MTDEFWGDWYAGYMSKWPSVASHPLCDPDVSGPHLAGCRGSMQTDAYSANTALSDEQWERFSVFRLEWRAGEGVS